MLYRGGYTISPLAPFRARTLHQAIHDPLPDPTWLVDQLITDGSRVLLFGEWGAFKSWLLADLACAIATGNPVWDGHVTRQTSVLYVDEEMGQRRLEKRIRSLQVGQGYDENGALHLASWQGVRLGASGGRILLERLEEAHLDPDVIIIESVRTTMVGDENAAVDANTFWNSLLHITALGKTIIVSHHMRKPRYFLPGQSEERNRDKASGSTALLSHPDACYAVIATGRSSVRIECVKQKDGDLADPIGLSLQITDTSAKVGSSHVGRPGTPIEEVVSIARMILQQRVTLPQTEFTQLIQETASCSRSSAYNAISVLRTTKCLTTDGATISIV